MLAEVVFSRTEIRARKTEFICISRDKIQTSLQVLSVLSSVGPAIMYMKANDK